MTAILLSIRPLYAQQILDGSKKYEYRRICPKQTITNVVLYVTAPVCRIVAEVEVINCLIGTPEELWFATMDGSDLCKDDLMNYYAGCKMGCALELGTVQPFEPLRSLQDYGLAKAPRSFVYLSE